MANGLLEIRGTLDVNQFWPAGESDGDTAKVTVARNSFGFRAKPGARWKFTHAFDGAVVKKGEEARSGQPAIDKKGRITVRWQGIDAPELHYRPTVEKLTTRQKAALKAVNGNFRQHFGEAAAVALARFLKKRGKATLPVVVRTAVDDPSEVFDVYGRLVGDIFTMVNRKEVDLNHWMVQNGWAFPTFYASMSAEEIETILRLANAAKTKKRGFWKLASAQLKEFDATLRFRDEPPAGHDDTGAVIMPKLFRRLSTFSVQKKAAIVTGTLVEYLQRGSDGCYETADFLAQGPTAATHRLLDEFVSNKNVFTVAPGGLVFQEAGSVTTGRSGRGTVW
jgi:endonuclease YncB( thermonuclease family)